VILKYFDKPLPACKAVLAGFDADSSDKNKPNLATTKPSAMTAKPDRTHASKVRSAAKKLLDRNPLSFLYYSPSSGCTASNHITLIMPKASARPTPNIQVKYHI
jgi:hypothetical protein